MTKTYGGARFVPMLVLTAAVLAAPATTQAQEPEPEEDCVCLEGLPVALRRVAHAPPPRARLGVMLGEPEAVDGRQGVRLREVPEGTPAHRAGLMEGDVVVAIDGAALGPDPTRSLIEIMRAHEPGDTVTLTFHRDGVERTASVVTDETRMHRFFVGGEHFELRRPGMDMEAPGEGIRRMRLTATPSPPALRRVMQRDRLELVTVNPELGEYFGTDRGVLVASIDEESGLGLRAGDVILAIDGREVRTPAHARSILRSYLDDEEVTFRIVREKRERTMTGTR